MFNTVRTTAVSTKNFVSKHRVAIAVTLTAALAVKWQMNTVAEYNEFLKENGLYDAFYTQLEEEIV